MRAVGQARVLEVKGVTVEPFDVIHRFFSPIHRIGFGEIIGKPDLGKVNAHGVVIPEWGKPQDRGNIASAQSRHPRPRPFLFRLIAMGGWIALGSVLEAERGKLERDFIRHYSLAEKAGVQFGKEAPRVLVGRIDQARIRDGYAALPCRNAITGEVAEWKPERALPEPRTIKQLTEGVLTHEA